MNEFLEKCLSLATNITGVLHIGAHEGQEAALYLRHRIDRVTWIEANPDLESRLRANVEPYGHRVIIAAVGACFDTNCPLHVTSNDGHSSSLLPLAKHCEVWPDVVEAECKLVEMRMLDDLSKKHGFAGHNFWVLDIQGMETRALYGAQQSLAHADYIVCEFTGELYKSGTNVDQLDSLLTDFTAVSGWTNKTWGFGEVFYRRVRRSGRDLLRCGR